MRVAAAKIFLKCPNTSERLILPGWYIMKVFFGCGFIWDFVDQAIYLPEKKSLLYGGDFETDRMIIISAATAYYSRIVKLQLSCKK